MSSDFRISLKMLDIKRVEQDMLKALHRHLKKNFRKYAGYLETSVASTLMTAISSSPTMRELQGGNLRGELGVEIPNIWGITMAVVNSAKLTVNEPKIVGREIVAGIRLQAAPSDLETLKTGDPGVQETEKGQELPWLEWLTNLGDAVIVRDYEVRAGFPKNSRTGDKIMIKGKGWRVPPEHAGTEEDNFITRAIEGALPQIEKDVMYYFKNALTIGV